MLCNYKLGDKMVYKYIMPLIRSNMYMIVNGHSALIIDPNFSEQALQQLSDLGIEHAVIILTHEHYDHISGVNVIRDQVLDCNVFASKVCEQSVENPRKNLSAYFAAMFIGHSEEEQERAKELFRDDYRCQVDVGFEDEYELIWEGLRVHMTATPGHSPGSICITVYENEDLVCLFSGDSLVRGVKVVTRLPGGNKAVYQKIAQPFLQSMPAGTIVFPGHGEEGGIEVFAEELSCSFFN